MVNQQSWSYGSGPMTDVQRESRHRGRAIWIRESLLHLGPTFIQIGQFFSTRAGLFPAPYIEELSKLQDQVPAFDYEQVRRSHNQNLSDPYIRFSPTLTPFL